MDTAENGVPFLPLMLRKSTGCCLCEMKYAQMFELYNLYCTTLLCSISRQRRGENKHGRRDGKKEA